MIPATVHRIWLGGQEPEWIAELAASWERPGWQLRRWDDEAVEQLFPLANQAIYDRAPCIAPRHVGQLRADVVRYEILYRCGGVYVDADFECLRPLDPLLDRECFVARESPAWINNAVIGAVAGHPFIERLVTGLAASVEANAGFKPNRLSGPRYLTGVWRADPSRVQVLPSHLFYPYSWTEIDEHEPGEEWPESYAVHHWANKRRGG